MASCPPCLLPARTSSQLGRWKGDPGKAPLAKTAYQLPHAVQLPVPLRAAWVSLTLDPFDPLPWPPRSLCPQYFPGPCRLSIWIPAPLSPHRGAAQVPWRGAGRTRKRPIVVGLFLLLPLGFCVFIVVGHSVQLLHPGWGPAPELPSGLGPRAVTWASLSAEDEVDMNDGPDSEETISVPSHYGSIAAPERSQGESRGLEGTGSWL